jgi:hypothetical protein
VHKDTRVEVVVVVHSRPLARSLSGPARQSSPTPLRPRATSSWRSISGSS